MAEGQITKEAASEAATEADLDPPTVVVTNLIKEVVVITRTVADPEATPRATVVQATSTTIKPLQGVFLRFRTIYHLQ